MRFQLQQFDALYQLALEAHSRGKDIAGVGWVPLHPLDVALHVDGLTTIRFNGEGFDIYRAGAIAEINVNYSQALDVIMASAVYSELEHKPEPASEPLSRQQKGWITRRAKARLPGSLDGTKSGLIAAMLLRNEGATIAEFKKATGWQGLSVPHFAKRYGLELRTVTDPNTGNLRYFGNRKNEQSAPEIVEA
jgi:hypothetical protein